MMEKWTVGLSKEDIDIVREISEETTMSHVEASAWLQSTKLIVYGLAFLDPESSSYDEEAYVKLQLLVNHLNTAKTRNFYGSSKLSHLNNESRNEIRALINELSMNDNYAVNVLKRIDLINHVRGCALTIEKSLLKNERTKESNQSVTST